MKPRASGSARPGLGEDVLIGGLVLAALLVSVVVARYADSGLASVGGMAVLLLLVTGAGVGWLGSRWPSPTSQRPRDLGIRTGLALGGLWALEIGFNNVVPPEISTAAARGVVDNAFWAAITLLTVAVGVAAARRSGRARDGLLARRLGRETTRDDAMPAKGRREPLASGARKAWRRRSVRRGPIHACPFARFAILRTFRDPDFASFACFRVVRDPDALSKATRFADDSAVYAAAIGQLTTQWVEH